MTATTNMSTSLRTLSLLDDYSQAHEEGNTYLKDALWNLTKARQTKAVHAANLREDLVARIVLTNYTTTTNSNNNNNNNNNNNVVPDLVVDDDDDKEEEGNDEESDFVLVDVVKGQRRQQQQQQKEKENTQASPELQTTNTTTTNTYTDATLAMGLRHRKHVEKKNNPSPSPWTVETSSSSDHMVHATAVADPLDWFGGGLAPRALHAAQEQARKALDHYVKAANLRRTLQLHLKNE